MTIRKLNIPVAFMGIYPPLLSRFQLAEAFARSGLDRFWPEEEGQIALQAMRDGASEIGRAIDAVTDNPKPESIRAPRVADYIMKLQDYWNDFLLERVRPYAFEF